MNTPHPMKTDQTIASDEINSAPSVEETARAAADVIAERSAERSGVARHDIALVLGSGWAGAADILGEEVYSIPAPQVPGFRPPALEGHVGTLRSIRIGETGRHALVLGARTHLYEGHGAHWCWGPGPTCTRGTASTPSRMEYGPRQQPGAGYSC